MEQVVSRTESRPELTTSTRDHDKIVIEPTQTSKTPVEKQTARSLSPVSRPKRRSKVETSLTPSIDGEVTQNLQNPPPRTLEHPSEFRSETELFRLALLHQQSGSRNAALESYRKLLTLNPRNVVALNNMAVILQEMGRLEEAGETFRRALEADPSYDKAYTNLGVVLQLQDQPQAAIESHLRALAINERSWESAVNLGLLFWSEGDLESAKRFFFKALAIQHEPSVLHHLGQIFEQQGRSPEAIRHYRQALKKGDGLTPQLQEKIQLRLRELLGGNGAKSPGARR